MKEGYLALKKALYHFLYPQECLHCRHLLPPQPEFLCPTCSSGLHLIQPEERCCVCFNIKEEGAPCLFCKEHSSLFYRLGAAFDYAGVAAALIKRLKYGGCTHLAQGLAAFLVAQFVRLDWPIPDVIIPVPLSWTRKASRGYNQSELLALQLGQLLQVPVWNAIKRRGGGYSQASLSFSQRLTLSKSSFELKRGFNLEDKILLVLDDVITTGKTLNCCAEALLEGYPKCLYGLAVCRSLLD